MPTIEDKDKIAIDREDVESIAFQFAKYHEDKNGRYGVAEMTTDASENDELVIDV
jgi:hypothetical protein